MEPESGFEFTAPKGEIGLEALGDLFWDFTKKASKVLYDQFIQQLAKSDLHLTKKGQVALTRQLLIINMWSVCKAWMDAEDALEIMHQRYLKGVSLFIEGPAKEEDVWAFSKKELMTRYKEYYTYWMNNDPNVSNDKILALSQTMLREMVQHADLMFGGRFQSLVINHLKMVLKKLLIMKQELTVTL